MLYVGKFASNGKVFDSTEKRGEPFLFVLGKGRVIKGWDLGLMQMCIGEKRTLKIPSYLAYGTKGGGRVIPPNSDLIFDVELITINSRTKNQKQRKKNLPPVAVDSSSSTMNADEEKFHDEDAVYQEDRVHTEKSKDEL